MSGIRPALQTALKEHGGLLPFDRFMEIALHHPDGGYYATRIRGIGRGGDFTTVPARSRSLGKAVAQWLRLRGAPALPVIECGPGDGSLAAGILAEFGWFERRRLCLHLVETSVPLRGHQQHALRGHRAQWHRSITDALQACEGRALIYHNEFFDAFPCRVLRREETAWTELHLEVVNGRLQTRFAPPRRPLPDSTALARDWAAGQRIEVFEAVQAWMCGMAPLWKEGAMLAVDYGGNADMITHRRPSGTLRAYRQHERLEGDAVFEMPGHQDITADVNFEDVTAWAQALGWARRFDQSLAEFAGMHDSPDAGTAFRCLEFLPTCPSLKTHHNHAILMP